MALFLLCPNLGWIQGQFNFTELSLRYHEITICWSNIFYFERKPRVLAYNACPILIGPPREHRLNYNGWTIEFYPLGRRSGEYRHLCISSVARSRAWIKTSWLGCTDNLVIYGPPQDSVRSGIWVFCCTGARIFPETNFGGGVMEAPHRFNLECYLIVVW